MSQTYTDTETERLATSVGYFVAVDSETIIDDLIMNLRMGNKVT